MHIDVENQLEQLERSVSWPQRDGRPAPAITLARSFQATVADLWQAITDGARIAHWFLPVSGQLQQGGRFSLQDNADGTILACRPLSHLGLTWEFGGDLSWVDVDVAAADAGRASLRLTHTSHLSDQWTSYGPGAAGVGWELGLVGLAIHLAQPHEPKLDGAAFVVSPEGKALIRGSSERWAQAAVAAGEAAGPAQAAAERTSAFYTGEAA